MNTGVILIGANGDPAKANSLCGERRSQDTGGIFRLREMEHCALCFDFAMLRSERHVLLLLPMKVGEKRKPPRGRGHWLRHYFVSALAALRASLVLQNFSRTGTKMMHTKIAVKPPLYRQKPPCRPGTRVTRQ